jgi:hypothetical protein
MADVLQIITPSRRVLEIGRTGPQGPSGSGGGGSGLPAGFDIEAISNTRIKIKYTGSDSVPRSVVLTIA